ncbi:hypothetical protein Ga0100230_018065 [Opitutaceae bacterium TAV3]|nr:hypothetical protein Ga0100230_018065 [Opitutaceae bacterium TAV3]
MKPSTRPLYLLIAAFLLGSYLHANPPLSPPPPAASQLNLNGDGVTDNTDALQNLLDASKSQGLTLTLPPGTYLLGSVRIPANTTLRALPGAKIRINPTRLQLSDPDTTAPVIMRKKPQRFLILTGDNITLDGLDFDFTLTEADDIPPKTAPGGANTASHATNTPTTSTAPTNTTSAKPAASQAAPSSHNTISTSRPTPLKASNAPRFTPTPLPPPTGTSTPTPAPPTASPTAWTTVK